MRLINERIMPYDTLQNFKRFNLSGPHAGKQDKCAYSGRLPATTYADTVCSYSTNEVAINWNAPLVYMLASAIKLQ
jgi:endoglucanase